MPKDITVVVMLLLVLFPFAPGAFAMETGTNTGGGTGAVDGTVNLVAAVTALAGAHAAADPVVAPPAMPVDSTKATRVRGLKRGNAGSFGAPGRIHPRQRETGIPSGVHFSAAAAPSRVAPTSPLAPPPLRGSPSPAALDRMPQSPSSSPRPRPAKRVKEPWRSSASSAAPLRGSVSPRSIARCAPDSPGANLLSRFGLPGEGASAPPPRVAAAAPGALTGISGFLAQAPNAPAALGGAQHALVGAFGSAPAAAMQEGAQGSAAVQPLVPVAPPSLLRDAFGNFLGPKANLGPFLMAEFFKGRALGGSAPSASAKAASTLGTALGGSAPSASAPAASTLGTAAPMLPAPLGGGAVGDAPSSPRRAGTLARSLRLQLPSFPVPQPGDFADLSASGAAILGELARGAVVLLPGADGVVAFAPLDLARGAARSLCAPPSALVRVRVSDHALHDQ
jgi:hypothetical protein